MKGSTNRIGSFYSRKSEFSSSNQSINMENGNINVPNKNILLNPGSDYELDEEDQCFYISLVKEENYDWKNSRAKICKFLRISSLTLEKKRFYIVTYFCI